MNRPLEAVPVSKTTEGATKRDKVIEVIADKLGIKKEDVTPQTELGDKWREIAMIVAFTTDTVLISSAGMKASDIFDQL